MKPTAPLLPRPARRRTAPDLAHEQWTRTGLWQRWLGSTAGVEMICNPFSDGRKESF